MLGINIELDSIASFGRAYISGLIGVIVTILIFLYNILESKKNQRIKDINFTLEHFYNPIDKFLKSGRLNGKPIKDSIFNQNIESGTELRIYVPKNKFESIYDYVHMAQESTLDVLNNFYNVMNDNYFTTAYILSSKDDIDFYFKTMNAVDTDIMILKNELKRLHSSLIRRLFSRFVK